MSETVGTEKCRCARCGYEWTRGKSGDHDCARELKRELEVTEQLRARANEVLNAVPECVAHGKGCIPHAIEWIERMAGISPDKPTSDEKRDTVRAGILRVAPVLMEEMLHLPAGCRIVGADWDFLFAGGELLLVVEGPGLPEIERTHNLPTLKPAHIERQYNEAGDVAAEKWTWAFGKGAA